MFTLHKIQPRNHFADKEPLICHSQNIMVRLLLIRCGNLFWKLLVGFSILTYLHKRYLFQYRALIENSQKKQESKRMHHNNQSLCQQNSCLISLAACLFWIWIMFQGKKLQVRFTQQFLQHLRITLLLCIYFYNLILWVSLIHKFM